MANFLSHIKKITAKKKWGQNFLIREDILDKIILAAHIDKETSVIEIGPGPGSLTYCLLKTAAKTIYAIEKDISMRDHLEDLKSSRLHLYFSDALKTTFWELGNTPRSLISNLPYNIATPLLLLMLLNASCFKNMVLMFQKEVALRILAQPNTKAYGRLSVISQLLCKISHVTDVAPNAFHPQPKVNSTVLHFSPYTKPLYNVNIHFLQKLLHHVFQQRRKMLRSNLKNFVDNPIKILDSATIDSTRRPESLSLKEFVLLSNLIERST